MKIFMMMLLALFSLSTYAGLVMKPGLWEIEMSMAGADGKQADPMGEMRKAMAKMSPEQQKQMAAMMGKMGGMGMSPTGAMRVCYTKEMLENEGNLNQQKDKKCTSNIKEKSSTRVVADFKCDDGTVGTSVFTVADTSYTGNVDVTDKTGQKRNMTMKGKFTSADCGDVKPLGTTAKSGTMAPAIPPSAKPNTTH